MSYIFIKSAFDRAGSDVGAENLRTTSMISDTNILSSTSLDCNQCPMIILMRGLPGSGKSTLARKLAKDKSGQIFSADNYFMRSDGVYVFDRRKIRDAHQDTQKRIENALFKGVKYIIADNTHITRRDMNEYLKIAAHHDALVKLVLPQTPWAWNPIECARRNVHGVPVEAIRNMNERYQHMENSEAQSIVSSLRGFIMGHHQ